LASAVVAIRQEFNDRLASAVVAIRQEFNDRLASAVVAIRQDFAERMGAAAVSFATDFSELRKELGHRIDVLDDAMGRRMGALERRMDRIAETTGTTATELAALTRWANRLDRENLETLNTQAAQQRAIDDLAKRLRPPEQPSN
jgi:septal ring factor EnvC (AmiA/AmiB activator)